MSDSRQGLMWHLYGRVIDNYGDVGVCWRLARDLVARGQRVRLMLDDSRALRWMAPDWQSAPPLEVPPWQAQAPEGPVPDVAIEAFGCDPPGTHLAAWRQASQPPVWINLEYLSAEAYVERSHGLRSPQWHGPGEGLTKWFFYPGFTHATGGLLREEGLLARRARFDEDAWLQRQGLDALRHHCRVSLFSYPDAPLASLLQALVAWSPDRPVALLTSPGVATEQMQPIWEAWSGRPVHWVWQPLPWLAQPEYDHLLWSCQLNLVRGEDSFVRAQWAGRPFLWQIYPQQDGAHEAKLAAFTALHLAGEQVPWARTLEQAMSTWAGVGDAPLVLPAAADWRAHTENWSMHLGAQDDLCAQLMGFVAAHTHR